MFARPHFYALLMCILFTYSEGIGAIGLGAFCGDTYLGPSKFRGSLTSLNKIPAVEIKEFKIPNPRRPHRRFVRYLTELASLRTKINSITENRLNGIRAAIYIASGTDSAYAAGLAKHLRLTIAFDKHPFVTRNEFEGRTQVIKQAVAYGRISYVYGGDISAALSTAAGIVANLRASDPNIQILSAQAFKTSNNDSEFHGVVTYNRGPGTPISAYLHVNHDFNEANSRRSQEGFASTWWADLIPKSDVALLYKGSDIGSETVAKFFESQLPGIEGSIFITSNSEITGRSVRFPFFPRRLATVHEFSGILGWGRRIFVVTF